MDAEPFPAGEQLNTGEPSPPRPAATVLMLAGGERTLEVLLVQRNPAARFMAGTWVFPGGAVDPHEGDGDEAHRLAAVREVREETGLRLPDPSALVPVSRWVTPAAFAIRFDTWFFLAETPPGQVVRVDAAECVDHGWFAPAAALERFGAGDLKLVLPTIRHLQMLAPFSSASEALEQLRDRKVERVEPHVIGSGEQARVVIPTEAEGADA